MGSVNEARNKVMSYAYHLPVPGATGHRRSDFIQDVQVLVTAIREEATRQTIEEVLDAVDAYKSINVVDYLKVRLDNI